MYLRKAYNKGAKQKDIGSKTRKNGHLPRLVKPNPNDTRFRREDAT